MKTIFKSVLVAILLMACSKKDAVVVPPIVKERVTKAFIPDGWKNLEKFGGTTRSNATTFAIGDKIYIGLGYSAYAGFSAVSKDFFEYDPATNKWKAIAEFPGVARANAIVFVAGGKAYVGLGTNYNRLNRGDLYSDLYEYDPAMNKWTPKAEFKGNKRDQPVFFTIGNKGYFGSGNPDPFTPINTNEFWEYDTKADIWTQKENFTGSPRCRAFAFSIGSKAYMGGGEDNSTNKLSDFYEYDPAKDIWTKKANFLDRIARAVGFSIGDFACVAGGITTGAYGDNKLYKYDPKSDIWSSVGEMGDYDDINRGRFYPSAVALNGKAYIGLGSRFVEGENLFDFYETTVK